YNDTASFMLLNNIDDTSKLITLKGSIEKVGREMNAFKMPAGSIKDRAMRDTTLMQIIRGQGVVELINKRTQQTSAGMPIWAKTAIAAAVIGGSAYGIWANYPAIEGLATHYGTTGLALAKTYANTGRDKLQYAYDTVSTQVSETSKQISDTVSGWGTAITGYFR